LFVLLALSCKDKNGSVGAKYDSRPNIVLILFDDMGYSDIAHGGEIHTPNLTKMEENGILNGHANRKNAIKNKIL
jgi:arylsulfatase